MAERAAYDPDGTAGDLDPVDVSTFEHVTGSDHNDRLTGDHRANILTGGKGDDALRGGVGQDTLIGGPGADMLDGGYTPTAGNPDAADASTDMASYAGAMAGVTVNLATGRGTAGDAEGDTLVNIEQVVGSGNDDTFIAGRGADNINGDTHAGDDPMGGTDMEDGDTVSYELSEEGVTVHLNATDGVQTDTTEDSYAVGDTLVGIENVIGSAQDDVLTGDNNANRLMGGAGDDELTGAGGADTLMGGDGDDELNGGGDDNVLDGGAGDDTINGGADDDRITGGAGDDDLTGDGGDDVFVFSPDDGDGVDVITDFVPDDDRIDLTAFGIEDVSDLALLTSGRGGDTIIDLTSLGGGTIVVSGNVNAAGDTTLAFTEDDADTSAVDGTFIL